MIRNWALFHLYHVQHMNFRFWHKVVIQYRTPFIHYPKFRLPAQPFFRLRKTLHESNQTFCLSMLYCVLLGYSFEFRLNCILTAVCVVQRHDHLSLSNQFDGLSNPFEERKQDWQVQKFHGAAATSNALRDSGRQDDKNFITQKKRHKKAILLM